MRGQLLVGAVVLSAVAAGQVGGADAALQPEHGYVTDQMTLPATNNQAAGFGRDVDGNGRSENRLGQLFASLASMGLDLPAVQNEAMAAGDVVMLHSLRASTLGTTSTATWQVWYGAQTPDPNLTGTGTFSLQRGQPHSSPLAATIKNHHVQTAAGSVPVRLYFGDGPIELTMKKAKVTATCDGGGCSAGKLAGAVTKQQITDTLIPRMVETFQPMVWRDCPGTDPTSCMADSIGKTIVALFDINRDLVITTKEITSSPLVSPFLKPDLDLVRANGTPGKDGVKDALSFGFRFTTIRATLTRP